MYGLAPKGVGEERERGLLSRIERCCLYFSVRILTLKFILSKVNSELSHTGANPLESIGVRQECGWDPVT